MPVGVLIAFLAFASFSMADALIKGIGPGLSVFEIAFFTTIFSVIPLIIVNRHERWREMFQLRHKWLLQIRCVTAIAGTACVMYAFTHIPFAEAYAIAFMTPVVVTVLSVVLLKEHVRRLRWILLFVGFLGVLLVIRPGVRTLELGHLASLAAVFFGAVTTVILRHIAPTERRISVIGVLAIYSLVFNFIFMLPSFVAPSWTQMATFVVIGLFGGTGGLLIIQATRTTPANLVAPVQYSQLLWAIILGAVFYSEYPDLPAIVGMLIVLAAGIANVLTDKMKIVWKPRLFFYRTGL
ncbi:MAG: family transporter [Devosia sp.]|nr:family transporter [Devosia sp.]